MGLILIVDDNDGIRDTVELRLIMAGHETATAASHGGMVEVDLDADTVALRFPIAS